MQARLQKAVRNSQHGNPDCVRAVSRLGRVGLPVHRALSSIVANSNCELKLRGLAARLLRDIGRDTSAFVPLLAEFIAAGDSKLRELCEVIVSMGLGSGRLGRAEFDALHAVLRTGTPEQRYWVVDLIASFELCQVRHALIEVLHDATAPAYVRGWAVERLHRHVSLQTVRECIHASEDPSPEVRLWAAYTLGNAASTYGVPHPVFRDAVMPVLERMLSDDGEVPGWWAVRREAQSCLASLRGGQEEDRLQAEIEAILSDPSASVEEKHWAGFIDRSS
jgi:hypothetical protein